REAAVPEKMRHLLERHLLGQIRDDVALVHEAAVGAVHHRDRRLSRDNPLEPRNIRGAHRLASTGGFLPASGPIHFEAGRISRRSSIDSSTCAVQPATLDVAKMQVNSSLGIPAPVSTTDAQKSTLVALGR